MRPLKDSCIVVTGATSGIGQAVCARLAQRGARVIACGSSGAQGRGAVETVTFDLADPDQTAAAAVRILALAKGRVDGLVNSAGVIVDGPLELVRPADLRRQFDVNVLGLVGFTTGLLPGLRAARGTVVNIGAISARVTMPFFGPIAASKAALASLSETLRMELAGFGVQVTLIEPGGIAGTQVFARAAVLREAAMRSQPAERVGLYRAALEAWGKAMGAFDLGEAEVVVRAVERALVADEPKPRVAVGKGVGALLGLARLPIKTRERLLRGQLGLTKAFASTQTGA